MQVGNFSYSWWNDPEAWAVGVLCTYTAFRANVLNANQLYRWICKNQLKKSGTLFWLYYCMWVWLGPLNPTLTIYIYFQPSPLPFHPADMKREPPPLSTALWEEFRWSDLTIKSECEQKGPQYPLAAAWICGFTVVLTYSLSSASNNLISSSSTGKRVSCLSYLGLSLCLFSRSLGC